MKHKNFQTQEDTFAKIAQGLGKICHEVLLLMKYLETKPQVKNVNINYYDLYYTVIKNRNEKDKEEQYEKNYIHFNDFIAPNQYIGIKNENEILR